MKMNTDLIYSDLMQKLIEVGAEEGDNGTLSYKGIQVSVQILNSLSIGVRVGGFTTVLTLEEASETYFDVTEGRLEMTIYLNQNNGVRNFKGFRFFV